MDIQLLARTFYDYSLFIRGYSPCTIKRYRHIINFYCAHTEVRRIEDVSEENIRALFLYGRTQRGWKAATYKSFRESLSVFFGWCVKEGYLPTNPISSIEVPRLEKRLPSALSKQDALKLLDVICHFPYDYAFLRYRNHAMFATFIFAGLRKNEVLHLKMGDVDIENRTIFVRQGKGSKDRIVPMSAALAQMLSRYVDERRRLKKTCPAFFTSLKGNSSFTNSGFKWLVPALRDASGLRFTIHQLRHTFATLMMEGGCDIYSLSRMMGHADIKTTTIYLSATAEHLRSQIGKHPLNDLALPFRVFGRRGTRGRSGMSWPRDGGPFDPIREERTIKNKESLQG